MPLTKKKKDPDATRKKESNQIYTLWIRFVNCPPIIPYFSFFRTVSRWIDLRANGTRFRRTPRCITSGGGGGSECNDLAARTEKEAEKTGLEFRIFFLSVRFANFPRSTDANSNARSDPRSSGISREEPARGEITSRRGDASVKDARVDRNVC